MKKNKWALFLSFFVSALLITIMGGCKGSGEMTEDYDTLPKLREYTPPQFPETATVTKEKAEVRLNLRIDEEGNVRRATVLRSSGDDQLDSAAIAAARNLEVLPSIEGREALADRD